MTPSPFEALAVLANDAARRYLSPPFVPSALVADLRLLPEAAARRFPVRIGARGAAHRLRLARAAHAMAGAPGRFLAGGMEAAAFLRELDGGESVYLDATGGSSAGWRALDAALDDRAVWLLVGVEPGTELPPSLAVRLGIVSLSVPPLGRRPAELASLAAAILARLAARRRGDHPALSPAALAFLGGQSWPEDVVELEAKLSRALLLAGPADTLDVAHFVEPGSSAVEEVAPPTVGTPCVARPVARAADTAGMSEEGLVTLLLELAHEIKNPLVTLKTLAGHLPEMATDEALRDRFAGLAREAVERMDGAIENLLAFARVGGRRSPPAPLRLATLLEHVVGEVATAPGSGRLAVLPPDGDGRCVGDQEVLAYAFRNLLAGALRELAPGADVEVRIPADGCVRLEFPSANGVAARLRRLTASGPAPGGGEATLSSLPFVLARAVLARSGGTLSVEQAAPGRTALVVSLPVPEQRQSAP